MDSDPPAPAEACIVKARLPLLFWTFFVISAVTLGGGLSMVPVMAAEMRKRRWMGEAEFYAAFARAQAFPGPIAFSMAFTLGKALRGGAGAALACLGVTLPPFFAVLAVARLADLLGTSPWVESFFRGAYATVPGLAAALAYRMIRKGSWRRPALIACVPLAAALIVFPGWAVPIFFTAVAAWYVLRSLCKS
jgi:chromate transporter